MLVNRIYSNKFNIGFSAAERVKRGFSSLRNHSRRQLVLLGSCLMCIYLISKETIYLVGCVNKQRAEIFQSAY